MFLHTCLCFCSVDVPLPQIQVPAPASLVMDRKRPSEALTDTSSPTKAATPKRRRIDVIEGSLSSSQRETQKRPASKIFSFVYEVGTTIGTGYAN